MAVSWFLERQGRAAAGLIWLTGLLGILAVFSMTQIYMSSFIPAWQSWYTVVEFFAATVVLGGLVAVFTLGREANRQPLKWLMLGAVLLQLALLPNYLGSLGRGGSRSAEPHNAVRILRHFEFDPLASNFGRHELVSPGAGQERSVFPALALIAGLVLGRYLFYASGVAISVGLAGM